MIRSKCAEVFLLSATARNYLFVVLIIIKCDLHDPSINTHVHIGTVEEIHL